MIRIEDKTVNEIWELISNKLDEKKEPYSEMKATYEFQITDVENGTYQLDYNDGNATVYTENTKEASCVLKMKEKYFKKFLQGDLNSTTAFMTSKLKVDGNIGLALKLENMLKQYDFSN